VHRWRRSRELERAICRDLSERALGGGVEVELEPRPVIAARRESRNLPG
jgi:hypothetical protein